jgi:hypothetical protein
MMHVSSPVPVPGTQLVFPSFVEACQAVNVPRPYPTPAHTPDPVDLYDEPPFVCPAYLHPSRLQRHRSSGSHCRPQTGTVPMGRCPRARVARDPKVVSKEVSKDRGEIRERVRSGDKTA